MEPVSKQTIMEFLFTTGASDADLVHIDGLLDAWQVEQRLSAYLDGREAGNEDGYLNGYDDGHYEGKLDGWDLGYAEGYEHGTEDAAA